MSNLSNIQEFKLPLKDLFLRVVFDQKGRVLKSEILPRSRARGGLKSFSRLNEISTKEVPGITPFQKTVYKELCRVKPGKKITYSELARRIGKEGASRAVGSAMRRNPVPIIIPCHRVVRADGSFGNYSGWGGTKTKKSLLEVEASSN